MVFITHLKALSSKAEAKLENVKAKYILHKTKAAGENNAADSIIMVEDKIFKAVVHTNATNKHLQRRGQYQG